MKEKDERADEIARTPPQEMDPETRCLAAMALLAQEGSNGDRWKAWSPALKGSILPFQVQQRDRCERGSWEAEGLRSRLRATALNGLALQVYYRYRYTLGVAAK